MYAVNSPEKIRQVRGKDWSQHVEHMQVLNWTGQGVWRSKRPLSACYTRRICSMEISHKSVKKSISVERSRIDIKSDRRRVVIVFVYTTECQ